MIAGIGIDLCSISRVEEAIKSDFFREELFSIEEIAYCESKGKNRAESYASCFAAREAFIKASGLSLASVMFSGNFSLSRSEDGAPRIIFPEYENNTFVSITHEDDYACAVVVIEK